MTEPLRVWAPKVKQMFLELVDEGRREPMVRSADGVFEHAAFEGRYMLVADGERMPDPRAPVMDDVLGPSRTIDHAAFAWSDATFRAPVLADAIIYELHVGTFSPAGTYDGAGELLPYLVGLGITHVELLPLATFSGTRGWGYDGAALYAPFAPYGEPEALKRFVDRAHALGLAVILDVVYNHLGPIGNWLDTLGPYVRHDRATPWGLAMNLDGEHSDEVRRFFIDNALMWLREYHFDGLRLDAIHAFEDRSAVPFLEQLGLEVHALGDALGKAFVLIAESDLNDPRIVRPIEEHGLGLDAQWSDDFHHALHVALTGEDVGYYADFAHAPLELLAQALSQGFVYAGQRSTFRSRVHGRPLGTVPLNKLVGYAQDHDQVGNRARGERLSQLVDLPRQKLALLLVLTSPFVPMLFMGEEWGASTPFLFFTDHQDPRIAKATREGRRNEFVAFGWKPDEVPDPQAEDTFTRSRLRHDERRGGVHAELLALTKAIIALRRAAPELRDGRVDRVDVTDGVLTMKRGAITIVANFSVEERPLVGEVILATEQADVLRPFSGAVLRT